MVGRAGWLQDASTDTKGVTAAQLDLTQLSAACPATGAMAALPASSPPPPPGRPVKKGPIYCTFGFAPASGLQRKGERKRECVCICCGCGCVGEREKERG
ncbi:hypothetical protein CGRA01v4_00846 [Colletotrichum graminicola]|nr:hypothetical protein CGRA01v4_00846 [Colletotrichum graminicola]